MNSELSFVFSSHAGGTQIISGHSCRSVVVSDLLENSRKVAEIILLKFLFHFMTKYFSFVLVAGSPFLAFPQPCCIIKELHAFLNKIILLSRAFHFFFQGLQLFKDQLHLQKNPECN